MTEATLQAVLYQIRESGPDIVFDPATRGRLLDLESYELDKVRARLRRDGMPDDRIAAAFPNGRDEIGPEEIEAPPPNSLEDYGTVERMPDAEPEPKLTFLDAASFEEQSIPERRWLVRNRIPMGNVTLLNGDGAAGKTTITLQLAAAMRLNVGSWLGAGIEEPGPALFFSAEEDPDEVHRRLGAIVAHHGTSFRDLAGLHLHCIPGEDAVLGAAGRNGVVQPTPLYRRLETATCELRPALVAIEASADVFAGNENDRAQVRQFIALLRSLAIKSGAAVLLLAHPSLTGLNSGTGTSGLE
jgi:AAA domain